MRYEFEIVLKESPFVDLDGRYGVIDLGKPGKRDGSSTPMVAPDFLGRTDPISNAPFS